MQRENRLRSHQDFNRVYRKGKRAATRHLAIRALKVRTPRQTRSSERSEAPRPQQASGLEKPILKVKECADDPSSAPFSCAAPRFGISISKKVNKRAVVRNRIKRQLKAVLHRHLPNVSPGWQVVIVVRPPAVECSFDDFLRELDYLLKKLEIVT